MDTWVKSQNIWLKRAAIVTIVKPKNEIENWQRIASQMLSFLSEERDQFLKKRYTGYKKKFINNGARNVAPHFLFLSNSLEFLKSGGSPAKRAKAGGQKEGVLGEGIFARPPVLGGGWVCGCLRQPHKSEFGVRILFKVGSNFVQKAPP